MMLLIVSFFIILILASTFYWFQRPLQDKDNCNIVTFLSLSKIYEILDSSIYFQRMNKADLCARNATSAHGYLKIYKTSLVEFNSKQKETLKELVAKIRIVVNSTKYFKNIPWKFSKVKSNIENGYPHTLGDMIVLSDTFFRMSSQDQLLTLFHEQCHVFQRVYPINTHRLITQFWNLKMLDTFDKKPLARNNPDINNFIYGTQDNTSFFQIYNNPNPTGLQDSRVIAFDSNSKEVDYPVILPKLIDQKEHPYEIMACFLPHIVMKKDEHKDAFTISTKEWLSTYF